jgi:N-[(2S)-2-amino-2-carboxyethyl]-L-glutamate dehydrogenase
MLYLNEQDVLRIGTDWPAIISVINNACQTMSTEDFAQPVKPYLRYRDRKNRIIAMPAFLGGDTELAGIKWIASFPGNIDKGIKRAHSVTVLNDATTGVPVGIINTPLISGIRTAGVSGLIIDLWARYNNKTGLKIGMTGFGPIGRLHIDMLFHLLKDRIETVRVYDIRPYDKETINTEWSDCIEFCNSWEDAFLDADLFITCTVSDKPYINKPPRKGSLHLNVSLRDYEASWMKYADVIIVDDWEEVCREKTDIEMMHLEHGLQEDQVYNIVQVAADDGIETLSPGKTVMFNPMGMSVFDIAVGGYFLDKAGKTSIGVDLK